MLPMLFTHNEKFQYRARIPCCNWMKLLHIIENFPAWWLHRNRTEPLGCSLGVILDLCSCLWKPALVRLLGVGLCLYKRCVEQYAGPYQEKTTGQGTYFSSPLGWFHTGVWGGRDCSPWGSWEEGTEADKPGISKENAFSRNQCEPTNSWPNISRHGPLVGLNLRIY